MKGVLGNTITSTPSTERGKMSIQPMGGFNSSVNWPEGAIEDWQNGGSYGWIADKYGRGYSTVAKLIQSVQMLGTKRTVDIRARKRQGGRVPRHKRKPLTAAHLHVGLQLSRYRTVENDYSCSETAGVIKTNRLTIRLMELGLHDFRLSELRRIAQVTNLSIADLIGPEAAASSDQGVENVRYSRKRPLFL